MALDTKFSLSPMDLCSSRLIIAIIGYRSFALSVLVWGWGKKKKRKETNSDFGKYCVPLQ
jgi:hypothetical protein